MKRHLFLMAVIALFASIPLNAREKQTWEGQTYKYEVIVGVAPIFKYTPFYDFISDSFGSSKLDLIYAPERGPIYTAGGYSAEFGLNFRSWFTLAFNASASGIWHDRYDEIARQVDRMSGVQISVMPVARFTWLDWDTVILYSSVGFGGGITTYAGKTVPHLSTYLAPLGMQLGGRVFGMAEWAIGDNINMQAVKIGIGMKF